MVEHLADRLADQMERAATAGAGLALNIKSDILAQQMRRQAQSFASCLESSALGRLEPGFGPRQIDVEVLKSELQLSVIEPLIPPAELATLQLLDDEMEPFDLGLRLAEAGALGCERAYQLLQRLHIIRQGGEIDVHDALVHFTEAPPMPLARARNNRTFRRRGGNPVPSQ